MNWSTSSTLSLGISTQSRWYQFSHLQVERSAKLLRSKRGPRFVLVASDHHPLREPNGVSSYVSTNTGARQLTSGSYSF